MNKKIIYISLLLLLVFTFENCTNDFEEINADPNSIINPTPDLLLPTIIRSSQLDYFYKNFENGNCAADQVAYQYMSVFNWDASTADKFCWGTFYDYLRNVQKMIEISTKTGQNNYLAVALIYKSWMFQVLTDNFGDLPYSEALKGESDGINQPGYDTQEAIYTGILSDLTTANDLIGTTGEVIKGDILFGNNITKWKKFANSLKIRCLMRISGRNNPSTALQTIINDPIKYPVFTSKDDQAAFTFLADAPNQSPIYPNYGKVTGFYISKTMADFMNVTGDKRIKLFAQPTPNSVLAGVPIYAGVPNGLGDASSTYNGGTNNQSPVGLLWYGIQNSTLASPNAHQSLIMTYSELQFALAEAAEKGYISGGTTVAKTYYEKGIQASYEYWQSRIPSNFVLPKKADITWDAAYLAVPAVAYAGTTAEKLAKIATQKWIDLFSLGFEAWAEWRRTNSPTLVAGPNTFNDGKIPVRMVYPSSEQAYNKTNYDAAVARIGGDNLNVKVWWDVN
ncbi:MAG: hypothetical protein A2W90_17070 [Bacteroidetes bacterium GWF2_42_66]|nr:MAG: hypothetical protein A2W92_15665 [Bacteroidetes bacterium GWA2_42_15]OFX97756.1 MAG: hypothetical protein A2W89_06965 [Bacteroidetes bacterium GWE2_42_39]OFY45505.1 MAG: hypothetical protein A2W90_17070 [Bacteroidetes bacterium GWF2_42_66]HAZ02853.1 SusD/RagB family nutrient-binding outer membrane lipoprotein [Marinilabiliales bacterium]HBL73799.1 SusD/RagB family nutrient-binding outer membrane lipoprotein [Prolixibacteraceae bacterium]